jgi:purine-binding chemotaxis protein CheW
MTISESTSYVVFSLEGQKYALNLSAVERVVHVVEITPLPKAPETVLGIINYYGQIIPIFNIRRRFRLPEKEIDLIDQLIIAHTSKRQVALLVDSVAGVIETSIGSVISPEQILPRLKYIEGVIVLREGIVLIHDLDKFLSLEEEKSLGVAVNRLGNTNDSH